MDYKFFYRGNIPSNGNSKQKGNIREILNPQIKKVWDVEAYKTLLNKRKSSNKFDSMCVTTSGAKYLPLISSETKLYCHLEIEYYTKNEMRFVFADGDIDNRVKTLFDGLRAPSSPQEKTYENNNDIYYTMLEDDKLIKGLSIKSYQIFTDEDDFYIITLIPKKENVTYENLEI